MRGCIHQIAGIWMQFDEGKRRGESIGDIKSNNRVRVLLIRKIYLQGDNIL